ncbi:hypothetical protein L9F63_020383 [Diploptera punctata]|uniref:Uncharacterized protein n=1 Tax=Diploptera punctata TaxID=6984 RepID=A0AAD7ZS99_DIPPU|nr:hypothetical protein L9F63_020383 [Diploptera punctata]
MNMAWRGLKNRFALNYAPYIAKVRAYEFAIPEKYKGTILEKWANYWKNIYIDYKEVVTETNSSAKQKPMKAFAVITGLGFMTYCIHSNPDERLFRDQFLLYTNEMNMVAESVRNPTAVNHLEFVEKCYNAGVLRTLNLMFFSFIWFSNFDKASGLYNAHCNYLEPRYVTFHQRVIDIGFLGHWWILHRVMKDYDVNPLEFSQHSS